MGTEEGADEDGEEDGRLVLVGIDEDGIEDGWDDGIDVGATYSTHS